MNPVVRGFLAVIAGMIVAFVLIFVVQTIGTRVYPPPAGMDGTSIDSIKAAMAMIPLASLLFVLLSYAAGSVAGGWVAARFAPRSKMAHAMTVAGLLFCLGVVNLLSLPHPPWFWVASSAIYWLGAWSGAQAAGA
jgi:hypothetical protein